MPCNADELAEVELFELLDSDELNELAAAIDEKRLREGETLFHAGDFGESMYIVNSGEVELYIKDTTGQKIVLKIAKENDIFGEISMLDNRPRSATAAALTDTELLFSTATICCCFFKRNPTPG